MYLNHRNEPSWGAGALLDYWCGRSHGFLWITYCKKLLQNQKAMLERLQQMQAGGLPNGLSFKDVLVQFANMQQPGMMNRPMDMPRPEHIRPDRRRQDRNEDVHKQV